MSENLLPCVELDPPGEARWAVIWMHGLGASGHDFESVPPLFRLPPEAGVRFVFPHAPEIPVTINGGFVMPAWYDILEADLDRRVDLEGIRSSAAHIRALMDREMERGIPEERIILAGFSQGGALAIHTALRYPRPLGGLIALSTYVADTETLEAVTTEAGRGLRAFLAHGVTDPMVPVQGGKLAEETLRSLGLTVTWNTYPMQHEVCMEEITDLGAWLREIVAGDSA